MKYLSVCSGIEAASVAWHPLGWEPLAFSEIEPFPRKVLAHHYPDVPCHGDFTTLKDQPWIKDADVLVGGTPCQAFSIAGLRQSLNDDRGNLTLEFVRLANAIDDLRSDPAIIVWENVPGVLSVADNAFGCFLAALVGNDTPLVPTGGKWTNAGMVIGPQRSAAWRILDAQYFGVAQRRRRVFVVASAREGFDPSEILFEREGMRRHSPPSRSKGERLADSLTVGANQYSGFCGEPVEAHNPEVAQCLTTGVGQRYDPETETLPVEVVGTLDAQDGTKWGSNQWVNQNKAIIVESPVEVAGTMIANNGGGGWSNSIDKAASGYMVPVAFHPTQDPISSTDGSTHALGCGSSQGQASVAVAYDMRGREGGAQFEGPHHTANIRAASGGSSRSYIADMAVRRLTPRECERLQGFPDDYTAIPGAADGPRYKALGNSMAVPVMHWIGKRIQKKVLVTP
jgi:DNA (cytosine-5)-methyltransferase 1